MSERISKAFSEFENSLKPHHITSVDGWGPVQIKRSDYVRIMKEIEEKYKIEQGDPDFLEWFLTLIGRSPKIIEDETPPDFKNYVMGKPYEGDEEDAGK